MSSREIWQEDQEKRQARDTEEKIAVFHVTENSESVYFSVAELEAPAYCCIFI